MSDRLLFIGWSGVARGREERAVQAFNDAVGYYGRKQQEGQIEGFDAVFLDQNGTGLDGYFQIRGTAEQMFAMREDEEFRRIMLAAGMSVDGMRVLDGRTGAAITRDMEMFMEEAAKASAAVPAG